jgi:SAM-dependent methyltransferase
MSGVEEKDNILTQHKKKWDVLAQENDRYYVRSVNHEQSDEEYEASGKKNVEEHILNDRLLMEKLGALSNRNILEIGCGSGRITRTLSKHFMNVAALDISRTMLEKARAFVDANNVIFLESNGQDVPVFPNSVDFAFSFIVYQHFPTKEAIQHSFRQVARALKPGGLFKVQVRGLPNPDPKHWAWGPHYTKDDGQVLAYSAGFKVLETRGEGSQYFWMLLEKI